MISKKIISILFLSLFIVACSSNAPKVLHDHTGKSIEVSALEGRWLVITYWASWCDTCMQEIPGLNKYYKTQLPADVAFYGVNYFNRDNQSLSEAMNKANVKFPVLAEDPNSIWHLGSIESVPVTFIIDPKGNLAKKIDGPVTPQELQLSLTELKKTV